MNRILVWIIKFRINLNLKDYNHHIDMAEYHMKRIKKLRAKLEPKND